MPDTSAAISLSRMATRLRPIRDFTRLATRTKTTTVTARKMKYFHWSGARPSVGAIHFTDRSRIWPR